MFLNKIIAQETVELASRKQYQPLEVLQRMIAEQPPPLDFAGALRGDRINLIAEFKKASPSKGPIRAQANPEEIARAYAENGAAAISVLTEASHFQGSLAHLTNIRAALADKQLPLLRKDFLFDPYQIYESRAYGADALLLIVAILTSKKLGELLEISRRLGMSCLVEVHDEAEVATAIANGAGIIGINNRDLVTFEVDLATTARLIQHIPRDRVVVAESGLSERQDVEELINLGVDAVLIGEALMRAPDIAIKIKELGFDQD